MSEHLSTMECLCITISRTGPNTGKGNENDEIGLQTDQKYDSHYKTD